MDVKTAYRAGLIQGYKKTDQTMEIYKTIADALQDTLREQPPEPYKLAGVSYGDAQRGGQFAFSVSITSPASRGEAIWKQGDIPDETWQKFGEIIADLKSEWPKVINSMGLALNTIGGKDTDLYMECSFPYRLKDVKKIRADLVESISPVNGLNVEVESDETSIVQIAISQYYGEGFAQQVHDEAVAWFERNMLIVSEDSGVQNVNVGELEGWMSKMKKPIGNPDGTFDLWLIEFKLTQ